MRQFEISDAPMDGLKLIRPRVFADDRGFFVETYASEAFEQGGINLPFVQDNHALSRQSCTLRGLHFQKPPYAQDKLVRVARGRVWDVAVDLRGHSRTFGQSYGVELSAENHLQLLVPVGFAHGYLTLEPDTEVLYKVTAPYNPEYDAGIRWDDDDLQIGWPLEGRQPILSKRDESLPTLAATEPFA